MDKFVFVLFFWKLQKYIAKYNNYFYYLICTIHEYRNSLKSILYIHSKSLIWWHTFFLCSIVYKPAYTIQGIQWKASLVPKKNTEPLIMKIHIRLSYLKITRSMFNYDRPDFYVWQKFEWSTSNKKFRIDVLSIMWIYLSPVYFLWSIA